MYLKLKADVSRIKNMYIHVCIMLFYKKKIIFIFFKNIQFQNLKNLVVEIDGKNKFIPHCSSNKLDIRKHQSQ